MVAIERKLTILYCFFLLKIFTLIFTQKYIPHTSRMPCHTQCLMTHLLSFSRKFHCSFYRTGKLMSQGQPCVQLLVGLRRIPAVLKSQSRLKEDQIVTEVGHGIEKLAESEHGIQPTSKLLRCQRWMESTGKMKAHSPRVLFVDSSWVLTILKIGSRQG